MKPKTFVVAHREMAFVAAVQESMPYRWTVLDSSTQLIGALRLSRITYLPPNSLAELQRHDRNAGTMADSPDVYSVRAMVRTVSSNNKVEDFVLACFPLEVKRVVAPDTFTVPRVEDAQPLPQEEEDEDEAEGQNKTAEHNEKATFTVLPASAEASVPPLPAASSSTPDAFIGPSPRVSVAQLLPRRHDATDVLSSHFVLPCPTDIVAGLHVLIGLDGFTELRVEGPGTVVFSGQERIGMLGSHQRRYERFE